MLKYDSKTEEESLDPPEKRPHTNSNEKLSTFSFDEPSSSSTDEPVSKKKARKGTRKTTKKTKTATARAKQKAKRKRTLDKNIDRSGSRLMQH